MAGQAESLSLYTVLCEKYVQEQIQRDPSYLEYLNKIGQDFFRVPPPARQSRSMFPGLFDQIMMAMDEDESSDEDTGQATSGEGNSQGITSTSNASSIFTFITVISDILEYRFNVLFHVSFNYFYVQILYGFSSPLPFCVIFTLITAISEILCTELMWCFKFPFLAILGGGTSIFGDW